MSINHEAILASLAGYPSDAAFIEAVNTEIVTYVETWIRWTTLAHQFGVDAADAVYNGLKAISAPRAAVLISPGFDMASETTRSEMQAMAGVIAGAEPIIAWCMEQGRVVTRPCQEWHVDLMTADVLAECRLAAQVRKASQACDAAKYAGQMQAGVDPFDMAGIEAAMVAALREGM